MAEEKNKGGAWAALRDGLVRTAFVLALAIPAFFAYAALGARFGLHDWEFGLLTLMRRFGPILLVAGMGLGFLALGLALLVPPRRGVAAALIAALIPTAGLGYGAYAARQGQGIPPIHDVSTDLVDPPIYSFRVFGERGEGANSLALDQNRVPAGWGNPEFADRLSTEIQAEHYPDIVPMPVGLAPEQAFAIALDAARAQGWQIDDTLAPTADQEGRIEAKATSFWFGFVDDIIIRVRASEQGSVIDIRSTSRVGLSDLGANAKRIRAFSAAVVERLQE
jgi:uncharacterized protein (DUF1499 family)